MAKNKNKDDKPAPRKNLGTKITLARKAKRVLQSNGLHYFRSWAEKDTTGGKRPSSSRGSLKMEDPTLYRKLIAKGEFLNRRMDRPPEPKKVKTEEKVKSEE